MIKLLGSDIHWKFWRDIGKNYDGNFFMTYIGNEISNKILEII